MKIAIIKTCQLAAVDPYIMDPLTEIFILASSEGEIASLLRYFYKRKFRNITCYFTKPFEGFLTKIGNYVQVPVESEADILAKMQVECTIIH